MRLNLKGNQLYLPMCKLSYKELELAKSVRTSLNIYTISMKLYKPYRETLETIWACKLRKENLDVLYTKLGGGGGCLNGIDCFCKINM